jgi:hypothetical protein
VRTKVYINIVSNNFIKMQRNQNLLFNWVFLVGILLLALNDHFLKWQCSNWLTGKLSDFIGLLILPMFVLFIFPRLKKYAIVLCGLFFIFWKLPISENFITFYNKFAIIPITRVVDYTDLIALFVLPISYVLLKNIDYYRILKSNLKLNPLLMLIPSCFVFMATSPPISSYMRPNGDIHIGKSYRIKVSQEVILDKLRQEGFSIKPDSSKNNSYRDRADYYLIENVVLNNGKDTIKSIQFGFVPGLLLVNNVNLKGDFKISDWKELKVYSKYYRKIIKSGIIEELK